MIAACGGGDGGGDGGGTGPSNRPPVIQSITPDPLLEGSTGTISGQNFSPVAGANLVRVDGLQAVVTQASATQLQFTVPATCSVTRQATITVTRDNLTSASATATVTPDAQTVSLAVGEQAIYRDDSSYCLEIPPGPGIASYLFGVQSTNDDGSVTSGVRVLGTRGASTGLAAAAGASFTGDESSTRGGPLVAPDKIREHPYYHWIRGHQEVHTALLERHMRDVRELGGLDRVRSGAARAPGPARAIVSGSEAIGDLVDLNIRRLGGGCRSDDTRDIVAEVKVKTENTMFLVDVDNPEDYSDEGLQELADLLEDVVWATDVEHFGDTGDIDDNGVIVIVITKEINVARGPEGGTIGFVNPCDWLDRDNDIRASNEGEFFYAISPDSNAERGSTVSIDFLAGFMPFVLAHELAHIIQFSRRFVSPTAIELMSIFEMEGQATLAEEVVGHAFLGNSPGRNYGIDVALDLDDDQGISWYLNPWADLVFYWGAPQSGQTKVSGAPEQCTWTDDLDDPCQSRASWYGVTWSFLRWADDQFRDELGGSGVFQRALIDGNVAGFDNLANALSQFGDLEDLLAQWAAAMYIDDRVPGADPRLTFNSWNFFDFNEGLNPFARLQPRTRTFSNFSDNVTIRSPSMAYWVIEGSNSSGLSLAVTSPTGGTLPDHIQTWVVRMQ
jgi:hypothetical protein